MGGYSDSSDEERRRKKKKKKRSRSRSREGSIESSTSSRKSGKHKSKKKKRQRSRSRSPEQKYRRRSRSTSRDRGYRRSRSRSPSRRTYAKRSRSRSYDRRRSLSRSRRSRSQSNSRRRSYSRERRSRSKSPYSRRRSRSASYDKLKDDKDDPCANVPGFSDMTPAEQAKIRMQLALKAAAAADEKLKEQGVLLNPKAAMSAGEQKKFNKAVEKIEKDNFVPVAFSSNKDKKIKEEDDLGRSKLERIHDSAIFGSGKFDMKLDPSERTTVVYTGATSLAHPNLHKTPQEKMGKWIEKLTAMRRKKLDLEHMEYLT